MMLIQLINYQQLWGHAIGIPNIVKNCKYCDNSKVAETNPSIKRKPVGNLRIILIGISFDRKRQSGRNNRAHNKNGAS